jgi:hypothetical protein
MEVRKRKVILEPSDEDGYTVHIPRNACRPRAGIERRSRADTREANFVSRTGVPASACAGSFLYHSDTRLRRETNPGPPNGSPRHAAGERGPPVLEPAGGQ